MAQIPKGSLVKGPYKPICRDCAIYFSTTVPSQKSITAACILKNDWKMKLPGLAFWRWQHVSPTLRVTPFPKRKNLHPIGHINSTRPTNSRVFFSIRPLASLEKSTQIKGSKRLKSLRKRFQNYMENIGIRTFFFKATGWLVSGGSSSWKFTTTCFPSRPHSGSSIRAKFWTITGLITIQTVVNTQTISQCTTPSCRRSVFVVVLLWWCGIDQSKS